MTPPPRQVLDDVLAGRRLTEEEAVRLLKTRDRGVLSIAAAADDDLPPRTGVISGDGRDALPRPRGLYLENYKYRQIYYASSAPAESGD